MYRIGSYDIGNGRVKGRSSTQKTPLSFPATISVEQDSMQGFAGAGLSPDNDFVIEFEGKRYAVGDTVYSHGLIPVTIAHRSRIGTDYYRVLFAAALAATIQQPAEVAAVVSLPPAAYWDKDKQKQILAGEYTVGFKGRTLTYQVPLELLRVVPEGWGTVCLYCLDQQGQVKDDTLFNTVVGVVDVGTYITDLVMLDKLKIIRRGTDSLPHALHDIHTKLRDFVASQGVDLDVYQADDVLQQGFYRKSGRHHSITEQKDEWAGELTQAIAGVIRTKWNGGDDVDWIIVTGGGGPYIKSILAQEFEHVTMLDEHETRVPAYFANCEGAYRYALLRDAEKQRS